MSSTSSLLSLLCACATVVAQQYSSCFEILEAGKSQGDGDYFLLVNNRTLKANCDMTAGGWTLVMNVPATTPQNNFTTPNAVNENTTDVTTFFKFSDDDINAISGFRTRFRFNCSTQQIFVSRQFGWTSLRGQSNWTTDRNRDTIDDCTASNSDFIFSDNNSTNLNQNVTCNANLSIAFGAISDVQGCYLGQVGWNNRATLWAGSPTRTRAFVFGKSWNISSTTASPDVGTYTGPISSEIGLLTNLVTWSLSTALTGTIPSQVGLLISLNTWNIIHVKGITGSLPSQIGNLKSLRTIDFHDTTLGGTLPTEIGRWSNLDSWTSYLTLLSGPIPSQIGRLTRAWFMSLDNNKFNGTIPTEIGLASAVQRLSLGGNMLTGSIPKQLAYTRADTIHLENNQLSGTLPTEIGRSNSPLNRLYINNNPLNGTIPSEYTRLVFSVWSISDTNLEMSNTTNATFCPMLTDCLRTLISPVTCYKCTNKLDTASPTPSVTGSISTSQSVTPSSTVTPSATPSATVTTSVTPSVSITPTATPSVSITPTPTPSASITPTATPSVTTSPSISPTPSTSVTPTQTSTPSISSTVTPTTSVTTSVSPTTSVTPSTSTTPSETVSPSTSTSCTPSTSITPTTSSSPSVTPSASDYRIQVNSTTATTVSLNVGGQFSVNIANLLFDAGGATLSFSTSILPAWLARYDLQLFGSPGSGDQGTHRVNIYATDGANQVTLQVLIQVLNRDPVVVVPIADQQAVEGKDFDFTFPSNVFTDLDGDTLTYQVLQSNGISLPLWLNDLSVGRTVRIAGVPPAVGGLKLAITAFDNFGGNASNTFRLTIAASGSSSELSQAAGIAIGPILSVLGIAACFMWREAVWDPFLPKCLRFVQGFETFEQLTGKRLKRIQKRIRLRYLSNEPDDSGKLYSAQVRIKRGSTHDSKEFRILFTNRIRKDFEVQYGGDEPQVYLLPERTPLDLNQFKFYAPAPVFTRTKQIRQRSRSSVAMTSVTARTVTSTEPPPSARPAIMFVPSSKALFHAESDDDSFDEKEESVELCDSRK